MLINNATVTITYEPGGYVVTYINTEALTEAPTAEPETPNESERSGCTSIIGFSAVALLMGTAVVFACKRGKDESLILRAVSEEAALSYVGGVQCPDNRYPQNP